MAVGKGGSGVGHGAGAGAADPAAAETQPVFESATADSGAMAYLRSRAALKHNADGYNRLRRRGWEKAALSAPMLAQRIPTSYDKDGKATAHRMKRRRGLPKTALKIAMSGMSQVLDAHHQRELLRMGAPAQREHGRSPALIGLNDGARTMLNDRITAKLKEVLNAAWAIQKTTGSRTGSGDKTSKLPKQRLTHRATELAYKLVSKRIAAASSPAGVHIIVLPSAQKKDEIRIGRSGRMEEGVALYQAPKANDDEAADGEEGEDDDDDTPAPE